MQVDWWGLCTYMGMPFGARIPGNAHHTTAVAERRLSMAHEAHKAHTDQAQQQRAGTG